MGVIGAPKGDYRLSSGVRAGLARSTSTEIRLAEAESERGSSLIDNDQFFCTQSELVAGVVAAAAPITLLFLARLVASFLPSFFRSDGRLDGKMAAANV